MEEGTLEVNGEHYIAFPNQLQNQKHHHQLETGEGEITCRLYKSTTNRHP